MNSGYWQVASGTATVSASSDLQQLVFFAEPAARRADPPTSHAAAESVKPRASALEARILDVFATFGPLTDDELCDRIPDEHGPSVRTARSRCTKRGELLPTGETRPSTRGRAQTVWTRP